MVRIDTEQGSFDYKSLMKVLRSPSEEDRRQRLFPGDTAFARMLTAAYCAARFAAHRFFCACDIRFRAAADILRGPRLPRALHGSPTLRRTAAGHPGGR